MQISKLFLFYSISAVLLVLMGCSDVQVTPKINNSVFSSDGNFCLTPNSQLVINKFLFVVDVSGSNQTSDPQNVRRADNIETFLNQKRSLTNVEWGYIKFGTSAQAESMTTDTQTGEPGFGEATQIDQALADLRANPAQNGTPYVEALQMAKSLIAKDKSSHPEQDAIYTIFFLSDGVPNTGTIVDSPTDQVLMAVDDLLAIAPEKITLSAVFYNAQQVPGAAEGMSYMAKRGKGVFKNLENNDQLDFEDLIVGLKQIPKIIKGPRLFVRNLNSGFCMDGTVDVDSDADGLCDKDETELNVKYQKKLKDAYKGKTFSPVNRNSIDSKFNDLFVLKYALENGWDLPSCADGKSDQDHDLLNECEESLLHDMGANGPTNAWTQIMTSTYGKSASRLNPDSDGDTFIDSLEFNQFRLPSSAVNFSNTRDQYGFALTGIDLMMENRHPMRPEIFDANQYNAKTYYRGKKEFPDGKLYNCYAYTQTQLALYPTLAMSKAETDMDKAIKHKTGENVILIYFIAVTEDNPNGLGSLMYSLQKLKYSPRGGLAGLNFSGFSEYVVPEK